MRVLYINLIFDFDEILCEHLIVSLKLGQHWKFSQLENLNLLSDFDEILCDKYLYKCWVVIKTNKKKC